MVKDKVLVIGGIALEKQAADVLVLHVERLTSIADYLVICSGTSARQVRALAETIQQEVSRRFGAHGAVEGVAAAAWVLIDYRDIIVHIFRDDIRADYGLESMWRDAPLIPQTDYAAPALCRVPQPARRYTGPVDGRVTAAQTPSHAQEAGT